MSQETIVDPELNTAVEQIVQRLCDIMRTQGADVAARQELRVGLLLGMEAEAHGISATPELMAEEFAATAQLVGVSKQKMVSEMRPYIESLER